MDKDRIPIETYMNSHMLLQKEIFSKETRAFSLSYTPDMPQLDYRAKIPSVLRNPLYSSLELEYKPRQIDRQYNNSSFRNYGVSILNDSKSPSKRTENTKGKISPASKLKDCYDFNRWSPITGLDRKDPTTNVYYPKNKRNSTDDSYKISPILNSKRVYKGMGYNKTNIFCS